MKIVFMNGGLGNQLFQYIFFRWLEITTGESCVLDDSPFFGAKVPHNGYELERIFGVRPKRLSEFFDADTWKWLVEQRVGVNGIAQQLLDTGMDLPMVHEKDASMCFQGRVITCEGASVPVLSGDGYYQGYWLGNYFLDKIREPLQAELVFPPLASQQNRRYAEQIAAAESVGIHIRRGDMARMGKAASPAFFAAAIARMEEMRPQAQYFLFSDDLLWCRQNTSLLGLDSIAGRLQYVCGNQGQAAYCDLQLMTGCRHLIADRSSFSLLAGLWDYQPEDMRIWHWD